MRDFPRGLFLVMLAITGGAAAAVVASSGLLARAGRLGDVSYRFDPKSLRLADIIPVQEQDGSVTKAMIFQDRRGFKVALVPLREDFPGADRVLVVRWGRNIMDDEGSDRTFLIFSNQEFHDHPDLKRHAVPAALFRSELLRHFERAASEFLKGAAVPDQDRRDVEDFMTDFRSALDGKGGDAGDQPVAG